MPGVRQTQAPPPDRPRGGNRLQRLGLLLDRLPQRSYEKGAAAESNGNASGKDAAGKDAAGKDAGAKSKNAPAGGPATAKPAGDAEKETKHKSRSHD